MIRARANASATREVSIVIQRRPHCSATTEVVPEPQVGSSTRSPGSVVMRTQRATTARLVWTTYVFLSAKPEVTVSSQKLLRGKTGKSLINRTYRREDPIAIKRF